jgi:acyl-CoA synthetase (AMP-forming)/AMP-acid ligase II
MNIASLLNIAELTMPDAPALRDGQQVVTYAELFGMARATRATLEGRGGGTLLGATVSTMQTVTAAHVATFLGTLIGGASLNVLNYRLRGPELSSLIDEVHPHSLVVDERYASMLEGHGAWVWEQTPQSASRDDDPADVPDDQTAICLFTSGTTGRPKLVRLSHGSLAAYLLNTFTPADGATRGLTLMSVPTYHVAGLSTLLGSLYSGRTVALLGDFDAGRWLTSVAQDRPDHAFVVPTMMRRILAHPDFDKSDLTSLALVSYGSDTMPRPTIEEALKRFPATTDFVNAYGLTEAGGTTTILGPDDHRAARRQHADDALTRLGSVGRPVPDVEIEIRDANHEPLHVGEVGEVVVRRTGAQWLVTGDLGYLDDDGYLFLAGRAVDRIVRAGENIDPVEIEAVLLKADAVADVAVFGQPDLEWGESIAAAIVLRPGFEADEEALKATVKARLASFKVPQTMYFVAQIPRNPLGKVARTKLDNQLREGQGNG